MQQFVGTVGMVACFALSSVLLFKDKLALSVWSGLGALAFLGLSMVDPALLRHWLGKVFKAKGAEPGRKEPARLSKAAKALPAGLPAVPSLPQWSVPEAVELTWNSYLMGAGGALLLGQLFIFGLGKALAGWALTAVALALFADYLRSDQPSFRLRLVPTLPKMLAWCGLGLGLEVAGFWMHWIQHPYPGFILILGGAAALVQGLWFNLVLPARGAEGAGEGLRAFSTQDQFSSADWLAKAGALAFALVCFGAKARLSSFDQAAIATIIGTLALVYTFPWTPWDIRVLDRFNPLARKALSLGLFGFVLALGHRAQTQVYGGMIPQGMGLFAAAIVILALAFPTGPEAEADQGRPAKTETVLLIAIAVLALVLRAWNIGRLPVGVEGDEAGYGWWSQELRQGRFDQVFIHAAQPLYWYFAGATFLDWFGVNPTGIRLHSVLHGFLGILTFHLFARQFFNWRTAIVTTLLLTFSTWHLHFSRFGHYNVTTHFSQLLMMYFLFRAARHQRLLDFVLAGFTLSIAAQSHVAARLIPVFLTAFVLYLLLFQREKFNKLLPGVVLIVAVSWILLSGPWVQFIKNPLWMLGRVKDVSITNTQNSNAPADVISGVAQSFKLSMLMFNFRGDSRPRDNFLAPEPMFDHWTAVLFALGFGLSVVGWRRPLYAFTLLAFFGTMLNSIMSVEAPQSLRAAGAITFCYLMIAFVLDRVRWGLEEVAPKAGQAAFLILGLWAALWIGRANWKAYLERGANQTFDSLATEIGMHAQGLGKGSKVMFQSEYFGSSHPPVFFFADGVPISSQAEAVAVVPSIDTAEKGIYFGFSDRYRPNWKTARLFYPQAQTMTVESWLRPGTADYEGLWVPKAQLEAAHGLQASYGGLVAPVERIDRVLSGEGQVPPGATSAVWKGTLYSPAYCNAQVYLETQGEASVTVNGRLASTTSGGVPSAKLIRLPGGVSSLRVSWQGKGQPGRLVWDRRGLAHMGQGYFALPGHEGGKRVLEARYTFHQAKAHGLLQRFYTGLDFKGEPLIKVDPVMQGHWVSSSYGPVSWRWTGNLVVDKAGTYSFRVSGGRGGRVAVDGRTAFASGTLAFVNGQPLNQGPARLSPGRHTLEVSYQTNGEVEFDVEWSAQLEGGQSWGWELLPAEALEPEPYSG